MDPFLIQLMDNIKFVEYHEGFLFEYHLHLHDDLVWGLSYRGDEVSIVNQFVEIHNFKRNKSQEFIDFIKLLTI